MKTREPRGLATPIRMGALAIFLLSGSAAFASPIVRSVDCAAIRHLAISGYEIDFSNVEYISDVESASAEGTIFVTGANFRPFCRVTGYFEKRTGADGQSYAIGFGLSLPDDWNGRFLFQGGGGLNGFIREPLGATAAGDVPALFRGFAVASTDSGHQSDNRFDVGFFADQQALLNFYEQAVVKTTDLAQKIVAQYYGDESSFSYFAGCSTGGREAMTMSQRYPRLYNGIVAGAPAMRTNYSEIADLWSAVTLRALIDENSPQPFSRDEQDLIVESLLKSCDALDGIEDEMISNITACDFSPSVLACESAEDGDRCLAKRKVFALEDAFAGPRDETGANIYPGFFMDTGIAASGESGVPGLLQGIAGPLGRPRMEQAFDLAREVSLADGFPLAPGNSTSTDLSTFAHEGNRLMFFHGVSDPWFSAKDTLAYYEQLASDGDGLDAAREWSRLYLVPGMGHCRGGNTALDTFDMLGPLVDWVENGIQPDAIKATGRAFPGRSRPLCDYPSHSHYKGSGDSELMENFDCR